MFEKVLVANRGEIAVRVIHACKDLGIDNAVVYSDADRHSGHVREADEAYHVGPASATESYLDQEAVLEAAENAGADAVHPGYGFLAENAEFAAKVEEREDLTWIGPSAKSMEQAGEKTNARTIMQDADVPIVPGTTDPVETVDEIHEFGDEHGYPIAIKAEGGGGGRGMKIVRDPEEAEEQLDSAKREGDAYFDNDSVYLESYLENPRHIEVQILADQHGNVRHLGERDCSLQRRHQKVVEEGPSPALSDELREDIAEAARRGAKAADYYNAGTFEFLVQERDRDAEELLDADTDFYFLEVNTRIQVEHTVTEELTDIDIVKWQIRIAAGEEIDLRQDAVDLHGHAIEYRINAESAADDFAPSRGGTLETYDPPSGIGVRVDDSLRQGDDLVTDYDSMIAKLVVHGSDREECLRRSERALAGYLVEGVSTIIPFHRAMLRDDTFTAGTHTTKYLDEDLEQARLAKAQEKWGTQADSEGIPDEYSAHDCVIEVDGQRHDVTVFSELDGITHVVAGSEQPSESDSADVDDDLSGRPGRQATDGSSVSSPDGNALEAEMQGTVLKLTVSEGEEVEACDTICVLEAMKMENDILAPRSGTITSIPVEAGATVAMGDTLVVID